MLPSIKAAIASPIENEKKPGDNGSTYLPE